MNLELVKTVISQVGNVVGILLVAELAVWQVKKELVNKRNDEVNEKSFELCCELFELVKSAGADPVLSVTQNLQKN